MHHHGWLYTLLLVLLLSTSQLVDFNTFLPQLVVLWRMAPILIGFHTNFTNCLFDQDCAHFLRFLFFLELRIFLFSSFVCLILVLEPVKTAEGQNQSEKTANIRALFYPSLFGELAQIKNTSTQYFCGCRWQPVHVVFKFKALHNRCI